MQLIEHKKYKVLKLGFRYSMSFLEKVLPYFFSLKLRRKNPSLTSFNDRYEKCGPEFGILIQGPLIQNQSFTTEIVKDYRHKYPNAIILVVTADEEDALIIEQIKKIGVEILLYQVPPFRGIKNINMQITSTAKGINFLKEKGVKYVLKTRTDQRCFKPIDFLLYMRNLQKQFPIKDSILQERLIVVSTNSFKTRLYPITDMLMFGEINDMKNYWDIELDQKKEYDPNPDPVLFMKYNVVEGYLINTFAAKLGYEFSWNKDDSDRFLSKYFCVIDQEQLDLYWLKYERHLEDPYIFQSDIYLHRRRYEFSDWLNAYTIYE